MRIELFAICQLYFVVQIGNSKTCIYHGCTIFGQCLGKIKMCTDKMLQKKFRWCFEIPYWLWICCPEEETIAHWNVCEIRINFTPNQQVQWCLFSFSVCHFFFLAVVAVWNVQHSIECVDALCCVQFWICLL